MSKENSRRKFLKAAIFGTVAGAVAIRGVKAVHADPWLHPVTVTEDDGLPISASRCTPLTPPKGWELTIPDFGPKDALTADEKTVLADLDKQRQLLTRNRQMGATEEEMYRNRLLKGLVYKDKANFTVTKAWPGYNFVSRSLGSLGRF